MAQKYLHTEIASYQLSKHAKGRCGDSFAVHRDIQSTVIILCDGIGSGIKANIAANMCVSRAIGMIKEGFGFKSTFEKLVETMNKWRSPDKPFAAFCMVRIHNDGKASILSYDFPDAMIFGSGNAMQVESKPFLINQNIARTAGCYLRPGEFLAIFSDGITQAGMGVGRPDGFAYNAISKVIEKSAAKNLSVPDAICSKAVELSGYAPKDDMTVITAGCRQGRVLNIFSGPPVLKSNDSKAVNQFLATYGKKVVCGATTAKIISRYMKKSLEIPQHHTSLIAPPKYFIEGIDLVTEGAVTLNHLYNILDMPAETLEQNSGVTELYNLVTQSDWINFTIGRCQNPANENISFRQQGIINRESIIKLISQKLQSQGKLVSFKYV